MLATAKKVPSFGVPGPSFAVIYFPKSRRISELWLSKCRITTFSFPDTDTAPIIIRQCCHLKTTAHKQAWILSTSNASERAAEWWRVFSRMSKAKTLIRTVNLHIWIFWANKLFSDMRRCYYGYHRRGELLRHGNVMRTGNSDSDICFGENSTEK